MRVGVLGGGQLARMLALAGHPLGLSTVVLSPHADCPAAGVARVIEGAYDDPDAVAALAAAADVVTFEFENVPVATAQALEAAITVRPAPEALRVSSDRLVEKSTLLELGIDTAPFEAVDDEASLRSALERIGLPAILKTRRLGYDGKGQAFLRTEEDVAKAAAGDLSDRILEGFVRFERELSVIAVRSIDGEVDAYPLAENAHRGGILRTSTAPAPDSAGVRPKALDFARRLGERLGYVGVFALELFQTAEGLLANEMAPRVHNSGHWTIEGAEASQFENHMRAVAGLPLGSCVARGLSVMVNAIGEMPTREAVLAVPGAHLHDYLKAPRPGRKLGHVTVTAEDADTLARRLDQLPMETDRAQAPDAAAAPTPTGS